MINPKQSGAQPKGEVIPFKASTQDAAADPALTISWEMLERQLTELAVGSASRALVPTLISATRKQAPFKPAELVLREVLCIASTLMDETFHPDEHPDGEEGAMT